MQPQPERTRGIILGQPPVKPESEVGYDPSWGESWSRAVVFDFDTGTTISSYVPTEYNADHVRLNLLAEFRRGMAMSARDPTGMQKLADMTKRPVLRVANYQYRDCWRHNGGVSETLMTDYTLPMTVGETNAPHGYDWQQGYARLYLKLFCMRMTEVDENWALHYYICPIVTALAALDYKSPAVQTVRVSSKRVRQSITEVYQQPVEAMIWPRGFDQEAWFNGDAP